MHYKVYQGKITGPSTHNRVVKFMDQIDDCFCLDNFLTEEQLKIYDNAVANSDEHRYSQFDYGPFANQLICKYTTISQFNDAIDLTKNIVRQLFDNIEFEISNLTCSTLFLPWDIHCDMFVDQCAPGFKPFYQLLIPLHDVDSRTIIFDQCSNGYNDFYLYKQKNSKLEHSVDQFFWDKNLSMCWPEDREFLSIKKVMPYQRRGQVQGFARQNFHSSDNFHTRGIKQKSFVHSKIDIKI